MKSNIVLIGMPGVGKSTLGVVLAKQLGYDFVDTDLIIQHKYGETLQALIEKRGDEGFIELENRELANLSCEHTVVATGGSAVYGTDAMKHLAQIGTIVYLDAPEQELEDRLGDLDARGVVRNGKDTVREIFEERLYLYMKYAEITIQLTGKTLRTAVDNTVKLLRNSGLVIETDETVTKPAADCLQAQE